MNSEEELQGQNQDQAQVEDNKEQETTGAAAGTAAESAKPAEPAKPKTPWYDIRIGQLSEAKRLQEARIKELEAALALKGNKEEPEAVKVPVTEVEKRAAELAAEQIFNSQCNDVAGRGKKEFGNEEFQGAIDAFGKLGGMGRSFIEAALETGVAHKVIFELSKDMDEAGRIMGLSPVRQAAAVAKFAVKLESEEEAKAPSVRVSKTPAPIKPKISGGNKAEPDLDDPNLSMAEYVRLRNAQIAQSKKRA